MGWGVLLLLKLRVGEKDLSEILGETMIDRLMDRLARVELDG